MIEVNIGDVFINTKNRATGEIKKISRDNIITFICYEKILGFFKVTDKLVDEVATRTMHISLLNKVVEEGLLKLVEDIDMEDL